MQLISTTMFVKCIEPFQSSSTLVFVVCTFVLRLQWYISNRYLYNSVKFFQNWFQLTSFMAWVIGKCDNWLLTVHWCVNGHFKVMVSIFYEELLHNIIGTRKLCKQAQFLEFFSVVSDDSLVVFLRNFLPSKPHLNL